MKFKPSSQALGLVALIIGLIVLALSAGWIISEKHQRAVKFTEDAEARYARLIGIQNSKADLEQRHQEISALIGQVTYTAGQDATQAGNDAQQRIRTLFTSAGMEVVSTQILPVKAEGAFERIPLVVRLEGQLTALQSALLVLATQSPVVFVEAFSIQTIGFVKAETPQRLGVMLNLYVIRAK